MSYLTRIRLSGLGPFLEPLDMTLPAPVEGLGQWVVITGGGSTGKTTLLRALALALSSSATGTELVGHCTLTRPKAIGKVCVDLDSGAFSAAVRHCSSERRVISESAASCERPWVVGYGIRRSSSRSGPALDSAGDLHTLFDHEAALHDPERWLADLDADALRELRSGEPPSRSIVWDRVTAALCGLLCLKSIQVDIDGTVYAQTDSGFVPFRSIGDGRLTVACLVIDIIARWINRQQTIGQPIEADFLRQMTGFALIDEIGLHLHPKQQTTIVGDLRRLFPRMSFVATTHNPLCLLGARAEEIWTLQRNEEGKIVAEHGRQLPALMTAAQILKHYFGIDRTFPDPLHLGEKLQRLSFLMGSGSRSPAEEQEMYQLVRELRKEKADPGWIALPEDSEDQGAA